MFRTDDFNELSMLHKAVIAAKFSGAPADDELASDPTLAGVSDRIYDALAKEAEKRKSGPDEYWQDWRRINTSQGYRGQWRTAVIAARRDFMLQNAKPEERISIAKCYLSPFTCTEGELRAFLDEVDGKTGNHSLDELAKEHSFTGASLLGCSCELGGLAHIVLMEKGGRVCDIFFSGVRSFELSSAKGMSPDTIDIVDKMTMSSGKTHKLEAVLSAGREKKKLCVEATSVDYWL
ncbi:MAG: hypothetical protein K5876_07930 [Ruminiclostridium sp.]|nr:hypothetical protein [Ruminiclostridium sp.]